MKGRLVRIRRRSHIKTFGVAILAFVAALGLNILGQPIIGNDAPFLFFISALALSAWYGGFWPGILTTFLETIAVGYIFPPPLGLKGVLNATYILHLGIYAGTGVFISFLMKRLHSALDHSTHTEHELEMRVQARTAELGQANRELQNEKSNLLGILDRMQDAVYIVNQLYEIEYANPAMERTFGRIETGKCYRYLCGSEAGVCSRCWKPSSALDKHFEEWTSPMNSRVYDRFEARISRSNGTYNKLMILHDITDLKHAQEELFRQHREVQRLSSMLLTAQEAERMRISRELHDELGQALTLIKLKIGLVDLDLTETQPHLKAYCEDASNHVDKVIENMRRLSRDLSPEAIETLGVTIALRRLVDDFNNASETVITADIDFIDSILSVQDCIFLYRILQEGLNNIVKHSEAKSASISIKKNGSHIQFNLKDDGKGLDSEKDSSSEESETKGLGMTTMGERVRTLGGSLIIETLEGGGTQLSFTIPVAKGTTDNERVSDLSGR